jgi:hypothetical protein
MQNESHTDIAILRTHFNAWRKASGFSRETAVQVVVEAHEKAGFDIASNIRFEPNTRDTFERMKVNADRVYRWLDDESKENNLLPFNFHKSILLALPLEYRASCMNEMYRALGLAVHSIDVADNDALNVNFHLCDIVKETSEAVQSVAQLNNSADEVSLLKAEKEVSDAIASLSRFKRVVNAAIAATKTVGKVLHVGGLRK